MSLRCHGNRKRLNMDEPSTGDTEKRVGMDEDFAAFLNEFGPPIQPRPVPSSSIERYRGKLPD